MSEPFVDALGWIPRSPELTGTLARAAGYARAQSHRLVTLEHLLLALVEDPDAALMLAASGVDFVRLSSDVSQHVGLIDDRVRPGEADAPVPDAELMRILQYAMLAAQKSRRGEVTGAVVLAAILGDGKSPAAQMLRAQGLTFDAAIRALKGHAPHAGAQPASGPRGGPDGHAMNGPANGPVADGRHWSTGRAAAMADPPPGDDIMTTARRRVEAARQAAARHQGAEPAPAGGRPDGADRAGAGPPPVPHQPVPPQSGVPPPETPPPFSEALARLERTQPPSPAPRPEPQPAEAEHWTPPPRPDAPQRPPTRLPPPLPPAPIPAATAAQGPGQAGGSTPQQRPSNAPWAGAPVPPAATRGPPAPPQPQPRAEPQRQTGRALVRPGRGQRETVAVEAGQLVENIPRRMRVAMPAQVEVRIARAEVEALASGISGPSHRHELTITKAMSVRLRAPEGGFTIEPASPETQWIESRLGIIGDEFASWRWSVTPLRRGPGRLQLIVSARTVGSDGLAAETALPDRIIEVRVMANYRRTLARWGGWAAAAIVGAVVARFADRLVALALMAFPGV